MTKGVAVLGSCANGVISTTPRVRWKRGRNPPQRPCRRLCAPLCRNLPRLWSPHHLQSRPGLARGAAHGTSRTAMRPLRGGVRSPLRTAWALATSGGCPEDQKRDVRRAMRCVAPMRTAAVQRSVTPPVSAISPDLPPSSTVANQPGPHPHGPRLLDRGPNPLCPLCRDPALLPPLPALPPLISSRPMPPSLPWERSRGKSPRVRRSWPFNQKEGPLEAVPRSVRDRPTGS
mmetsp:Transcript_1941/g.3948  ORF Transcript_1941/g.3948 Transcript_1941/m.3948 type:complete len:231 (-) Transcript_1941:278-970(-)